jgi:hypothetical protein
MCSFIVVHERSITKCDLINNIIKTILPRSIGLFFIVLRIHGIVPMSVLFFSHNFVVLQFSKKNLLQMCLIKDGPFSPIRLFCHKYIETKRKSAKSDCVINSYIQNNKKN